MEDRERFIELYIQEALKVANIWESSREALDVCLRVEGQEILFEDPNWKYCVLGGPYKGKVVMWSKNKEILRESIEAALKETPNILGCMQLLSVNPTFNSELTLDYISGILIETF